MRKSLSVLLALVLILSVSFMPVHAYEAFEYIKVGLRIGSEAVNSFQASTEENIVLGYASDRTFVPMMTIEGHDVFVEKGGGTYLMSQESYASLADALGLARELRNAGYEAHAGSINGAYRVLIGLFDDVAATEETRLAFAAEGRIFEAVYLDMKTVMVNAAYHYIVFRHDTNLFGIGSDGTGVTKVDGKSYRGYVLADRVYSSAIAIVNLVDFDDYTASVVGSEMYASWHIEALKAQAVIARTYATTVTGYKSYGVDVTDDTRTQAYNGISSETASTRRAAQETSGLIVLYKGKPAQTFFTASSGGKTADVYSAWGGGAGLDYLKCVEDTYEDTENIPNGVWSVSYTPEEIKTKLKNRGVDIGDIENVYVSKRGEDERVHKLTFEGTTDSYSVTFDSCRTLLGLKSQLYHITAPSKGDLYAVGASGTAQIAADAPVLTGSGIGAASGSAYVLTSAGLKRVEKSENEVYVFDGRGHGHGVGLSQYGAKGMAEAGFTFDAIIAHYYPGTTLSN